MTEKVNKKVLLSALDNYGAHPFDNIFDIVIPVYGDEDVEAAFGLADQVAVVIWGGQDISPSIYGQKPGRFTGADEDLSKRDQLEVEIATKALELGIPIIGICRGAQLVCALAGGTLVQDVDNHAGGYHKIVTDDDRVFNCPSLHHQMMYPWDREGKPVGDVQFIAWCPEPRSMVYHGQPLPDSEEDEKLTLHGPEPEILFFPRIKALAIQSHPEFIMDVDHPFVQYTLELTDKYVLNGQLSQQ